MSILAFVGSPGAGKSYQAVENVILPALAAGRPVATNIKMRMDRVLLDYPGARIVQIPELAEGKGPEVWPLIPPGAIVVLDEVWRLWPSGLKANDMRAEDKAFLAEHRHMVGDNGLSTEIILVVQDLANISAYPFRLVEKTYVATKLDVVGAENRYRVDIYQGPRKGPNYPGKDSIIRSMYGKYRKEVYQYYQSHTKSAPGVVQVQEVRGDSRATAWRHPIIIYGLPVACLLIALGGLRIAQFFKPSEPKAVEAPKTLDERLAAGEVGQPIGPNVAPAAPEPPPKAPEPLKVADQLPVKATGPKLSESWRVAAVLARGAEARIYLARSAGELREIPSSLCSDISKDIHCSVDGEVITRWTGPKSSTSIHF